MELRPEFVMLDIDVGSSTQALELIAGRLLKEGMVTPDYPAAILKREEEFCTGLKFDEMGIALPHTYPEYVIKPCIAIGVLRNPVTFRSMGMPDVPCDVEMIFMLGVTDAEAQLNFLKLLMSALRSSGKLRALKTCKTENELAELFKTYFA